MIVKTPKEQKDPLKAFKSLDKKDLNVISGIITGTGTAILAMSYDQSFENGWLPLTSETMDKGRIIPYVMGLAGQKVKWTHPDPAVLWNINKRDEWLKKAATSKISVDQWEKVIQNTYIRIEELRKTIREQKGPTTLVWAEEEIKRLEGTIEDLRKQQSGYRQEFDYRMEGYYLHVRIIKQITIGHMLLVIGSTTFLANNPDVVKQIIDSTEKITVRTIDEISEVMKERPKLSEVIDALIPG